MEELNKLKDIREIVKIPDFSFYIFLALCIVAILVLFALSIYIINIFKNKKETNKKRYIPILKNLDFSDSKKAAYKITKYGKALCYTKESKEIYEQLLKRVQKYKYLPDPPKFDEKDKESLKLFLEVCGG